MEFKRILSSRLLTLTAWLSCALESTWSAGVSVARISREEVERWIMFDILPDDELRDRVPSGSGCGLTLALDELRDIVVGVVGSSLYITARARLYAVEGKSPAHSSTAAASASVGQRG